MASRRYAQQSPILAHEVKAPKFCDQKDSLIAKVGLETFWKSLGTTKVLNCDRKAEKCSDTAEPRLLADALLKLLYLRNVELSSSSEPSEISAPLTLSVASTYLMGRPEAEAETERSEGARRERLAQKWKS